MQYHYEYGGQRHTVQVDSAGDGYAVIVNGRTYQVKASQARPGELDLVLDGLRRCMAYVAADGANHWVALAATSAAESGRPFRLIVPGGRHGARRGPAAGQAALEAQTPGTVRQVLVAEGDKVVRGQTLALLEAMKMEIRITAPEAGLVARVAITAGQTVERGQGLFALEPVPDPPG